MSSYSEKRNEFIPIAEAYANEVCGIKPVRIDKKRRYEEAVTEYNAKWNKTFLTKMDELFRSNVEK